MLKRYIKTVMILLVLAVMLSLPVAASAGTLYISPNFNSSYTATPNEVVTFSVQATGGDGALSFQWYHSAGALSGCTNSTLTFSATGNDTIWCVVSSGYQTAETIHCNLTVNGLSPTPTKAPSSYLNPAITPTAPTITLQPKSAAPVLGYPNGSLTVGAAHNYAGLGLEIRYQWYVSSTNNMSYGTPITGATSATYNLPAAQSPGKLFYSCGVYTTNGVSESDMVFSNMVYAYYGGKVEIEITKSPTGETVNAGGQATFTAQADNADNYQWRIVKNDGTGNFYPANQVKNYYPGLDVIENVTSAGRQVLTLKNIPYEMNGMSVICVYYDSPQRLNFKITSSAKITVNAPAATPTPSPSASPYIPGATATISPATLKNIIATPSITLQPEGAVIEEGNTTTLSVTAANGEGDSSELRYQWYKNDKNSSANGTAIAGAQSATYTPEKISGSKYYYVGVWATDGSKTSKVVYSTPVAVTYTAAVSTPSPTPTPAVTVQPANEKSFLSRLILPLAAMLAAAAIAIAAVVILKKMKAAEQEDYRRGDYGSKYDDDYDNYSDRRSGRR